MKKETYVIFWDYARNNILFTNIFDWRMNKEGYTRCTLLNIVDGKRELHRELKSLETFKPAYLDK